jgi:hypothetical protein
MTRALDAGLLAAHGPNHLIGLVVAGFATWRGASWAGVLTAAVALASVVVCVLGMPETAAGIAGIVVNVGILAVLAWAAFGRGAAAAARA